MVFIGSLYDILLYLSTDVNNLKLSMYNYCARYYAEFNHEYEIYPSLYFIQEYKWL